MHRCVYTAVGPPSRTGVDSVCCVAAAAAAATAGATAVSHHVHWGMTAAVLGCRLLLQRLQPLLGAATLRRDTSRRRTGALLI